MKKAQSISINTIIVAAIAIIVMVIVVAMFVVNSTRFRISTGSCDTNGGACVRIESGDSSAKGYQNCKGTFDKVRSEYECNKDYICCLRT